MRAVTLWPRVRADSRTRRPVRPVDPMRRMLGRLVVLVVVDILKARVAVRLYLILSRS